MGWVFFSVISTQVLYQITTSLKSRGYPLDSTRTWTNGGQRVCRSRSLCIERSTLESPCSEDVRPVYTGRGCIQFWHRINKNNFMLKGLLDELENGLFWMLFGLFNKWTYYSPPGRHCVILSIWQCPLLVPEKTNKSRWFVNPSCDFIKHNCYKS